MSDEKNIPNALFRGYDWSPLLADLVEILETENLQADLDSVILARSLTELRKGVWFFIKAASHYIPVFDRRRSWETVDALRKGIEIADRILDGINADLKAESEEAA